jgi:hypothetical protein
VTEAERELVEATMLPFNNERRGSLISSARDKVAKERLDQEIPGWEKEAKSAYMFYRRACSTWYKWEARLEAGGIHKKYTDESLIDSWRKEYEDSQ